jgi:hypothetical protein
MMVFWTIPRGLTASGWPATTTRQGLTGVAQAYATQAYRPPCLRDSRSSLYPLGQQLLPVDKV